MCLQTLDPTSKKWLQLFRFVIHLFPLMSCMTNYLILSHNSRNNQHLRHLTPSSFPVPTTPKGPIISLPAISPIMVIPHSLVLNSPTMPRQIVLNGKQSLCLVLLLLVPLHSHFCNRLRHSTKDCRQLAWFLRENDITPTANLTTLQPPNPASQAWLFDKGA